MELDDMKTAWLTLDRRLETQAALSLQMYTKNKLDKARHRLRPLVWGQALQMIVGALIALWAAGFWSQHRDVPHLLIAGLIVHIYGIAMILFGAAMQAMIARIDYAAPVLLIQRQLAQLRKVYVRGGLLIGLPWWLIWMPFIEIFFKSKFDTDLFLNAPELLTIGTGIGIVGLLLTYGGYRWIATRPTIAKRVEHGAAGVSLNKAQSYLDQITQFEQE
ncbi:hypothetical protein ELE36_12625 [Pseudolysobacter antarcticus]|uniref:Serine/threonine protein kinase n=1 Tax=Pseudolysobacter antarcticus TaxID=2511995 RepID=A0A411HKV8_9GAMM|nr:hypothetical protein [Pseudolysobacter antarcticus]QBB71128.1 hypothetical protein ELE36_12625 [Pseudolysobacter antarcticus]